MSKERLKEVERLTKQLVEECNAGRGDDKLADDIRDYLDDAIRCLSPREIKLANGYCGALSEDINAPPPSENEKLYTLDIGYAQCIPSKQALAAASMSKKVFGVE